VIDKVCAEALDMCLSLSKASLSATGSRFDKFSDRRSLVSTLCRSPPGEQVILTGEKVIFTGEKVIFTGEQAVFTGEKSLFTGGKTFGSDRQSMLRY
jgi:hypothetical protein